MKLPCGVEMEVSFNEKPIPLENFDVAFQLDGSDQFGLPIMVLSLVDRTGGLILSRICPIADGALITITFAQGQDRCTREFRHSYSTPLINSVLIRGYLNHPIYVADTATKSIRGTSKQALQSIAESVGLGFQGVETADSMVWYPANRRFLNFARYILEHAHSSDSSVMVGRIGTNGSMRVLDLSNPPKVLANFGRDTGAIPFIDFQPNSSGLQNLHGGYKSALTLPKVGGGSDRMDIIQMAVEDVSLNIHPRMADNLSGSMIEYAPLTHPRNIHPNFYQARYRNARGYALHSVGCKLLLTNLSSVDALDRVTLNAKSQVDGLETADQMSEAYDGTYWVSSKSVFVSEGQYYERPCLIRPGLDVVHTDLV